MEQSKRFGDWLRAERKEKRLTIDGLAKKVGVSKQYISALERAQNHALTGKPITPKVEIVDRIAKSLDVSLDDARLAAGYAPKNIQEKPQTPDELIEAIHKLGVDSIMFAEKLPDDPELLSQILESIKDAIEMEIYKATRNKRP